MGAFIRIKEDNHTWWVRLKDRERLEKEFIPLLSQGDSLLPSQVIKRSDTRLIYRGNLVHRQEQLVVKAFKSPHVRDKARYFFGSPRSIKELRVGLELRKRGIPFPRIVAAGVSRQYGIVTGDVVLSREIVRALPLSTWVKKNFTEDPIPFAKRKDFLHSLASFIRKVHDRGICSDDFHQGNILLWVKSWEDPHFYLTDLHSLKLKGRISLRERIRSLAHLNDYCIPVSDRLRFLKYYYRAGEPLGISHKDLARKIGVMSCMHWQALWKKRAKKCLRRGKELSPFRADSWRGMVRNGYDAQQILRVFEESDPNSWRTVPGESNHRTQVLMKEIPYQFEGAPTTLILKYHKTLSFFGNLPVLVQLSPARRAWVTSHKLSMRGISVSLPVAFGEKRCEGAFRESFLVTAKVPGGKLSDLITTTAMTKDVVPPQSCLMRTLLPKVARLLRWMHQSGICLGGKFAPENILVVEDRGKVSLVFEGIDQVKVSCRVEISDIVRDLRSLRSAFANSMSSSKWEEVLSLYCGSNPFLGKRKQSLASKVRKLSNEPDRREKEGRRTSD